MQFNNKLKENNKGFTLIELIVTVIILALITAPFLSSFVSASKTNAKSKRIQEANELSQHIIEQFKGSSFDKIIGTSGSSGIYSWTTTDGRIDSSDASYSKDSTTYTHTVSGTELPAGFASGYSADVKLTPVKSIVNEDNVIPVIEELDKENCLVVAGNITKYDTMSGAKSRDVTFKVWKDADPNEAKPYHVDMTIQYKNVVGNNVGNSIPIPWQYADVPSIYVLYVPFGTASSESEDHIGIINELCGENPLNVYLIQQEKNEASINKYARVKSNYIYIQEREDASGYYQPVYLSDLLNPTNESAKLHGIVFHTNIGTFSNDKGGTVYDAVKTVKIDTIYNLDVDVKYDGKSVAKYSATKTTSGD